MRPRNMKGKRRWGVVPTMLCLGIILMPAVSLAVTAIEYGQMISLMSNTLVVHDETYQVEGTMIYGTEYVGGTTGTVVQNGNANLSFSLVLGDEPGSSGTYNLSGGGLLGGNQYIGYNGTGTFIQSGGTNGTPTGIFFDTNLFLGYNPGSKGTYELHNGTLAAASEFVGLAGTGTFTQSGGTHTVNNLFIGAGIHSRGTYNLEGGTLSTGTIQVDSTGSFTVSGGTHTVTGKVVNAGTIKTTNAEVIWAGEVTIETGGLYVSDPSLNEFRQDFRCRGRVIGSEGDVFRFSQDVALEGEVELADSRMEFVPGEGVTEHGLTLPAEGLALDSLYIAAGEKVLLENEGDLYVRELEGLDIDYEEGIIRNLIVSEEATNVRLIYDINANPELEGQIFSLEGGEGKVIPTPIPASVLLLGSGLLGLGLLGRRRRQS